MTLKEKTISGLLWSFADNFINLGVAFLAGIVLARLLTPREFGLIGMTTIFIAISNAFVQSGFTQALIRKKVCTQTDYSTAFYFNLLVSIGFYGLLSLSSSFISQFFNEPQLTHIIRVVGLVLIINGLTIVQQAQLAKAMNFKLQTKITIVASIVSGSIGVAMALGGYGVWSLVVMTLLNSGIMMSLLWLWNGWWPSLIFSYESFSEMFSFGSKLLVSRLIDTMYQNIYLLVIGRYFSAATLGYYTRAQAFSDIPSQNISIVIQQVSFPALTTMQDNIPQLKDAYRKLIKSTMLITFVLMLGMAAVAEPMLLTLIGEQWQPSVIYLQLLCFVGMLYPLHAINLNMLNVQGRSDLFLRLEIIKKVLAIPVILAVIFFGIKMMIVAMIVHSIVAYYLNSYWSGKLIGYSPWQQIKDIFPSFLLATANGLIVYLIGDLIEAPPLYQLLVQLILGGLLTLGLGELLQLNSYLYIKEIALNQLLKRAPTL
jgi:teichuronic acid exporter